MATLPGEAEGVRRLPAAETADARADTGMLELIAEGVTRVVGFGVAAIGLVRGEELEMVVVAGSAEARAALVGSRTPLDKVVAELDLAQHWGPLRFIPHEALQEEPWGWVPDLAPVDAPDAWHPLDALMAPLTAADGELLGVLSIDLPEDGRRPGPEQQRMLATYADQATRAALVVLEREALSETVRLAAAAREVVRSLPIHLGTEQTLRAACEALTSGFRANGAWVSLVDDVDQHPVDIVVSPKNRITTLDPDIAEIGVRAGERLWHQQTSGVLRVGGHGSPEILDGAERAAVTALFDRIGVASLLLVPIGVGQTHLGHLALTRRPGHAEWTEAERAAALDVGQDLGRVVLNARALEREHTMVQELRALDTYKGQLIATISHELKNPLTAITGHLEILETEEVPSVVRTSLTAMERSARRLTRVVEDLLLLARVGDPSHPLAARPVDLVAVARDAMDLAAVQASRKRHVVVLDEPRGSKVALGEPEELNRVAANLLTNAVKYTPEGGHIRVSVSTQEEEGMLALEVSDDGIGISPVDQEQLFSEFFRSTNPVALAQPGTGLGLTIVSRIVDRHGGRIEVDSAIDRGSTFRVLLPAAPLTA